MNNLPRVTVIRCAIVTAVQTVILMVLSKSVCQKLQNTSYNTNSPENCHLLC